MSPRKLSHTTDLPSLPTIKDYFGAMAEEQRNDIRRLKQAATATNSGQPEKKQTIDDIVPNPWLLHPIRPTKRLAEKLAGKSTVRSASKKAPKKPARKPAKKASKKTRQ